MSFFEDWGPLNIAMVYKACILIHELLEVRFSPTCSLCCLRLFDIGQGDEITSSCPILFGQPKAKSQRGTSDGTVCGWCLYL
jgi:hypothetical protein